MLNMKTITVKPNQTIFDLAVENYGTGEAIGKIITDNPDLRNDKAALAALGVDYLSDSDFYPDVPVDAGFTLLIDTDSFLIKTSVVREITNEVTTFNL